MAAQPPPNPSGYPQQGYPQGQQGYPQAPQPYANAPGYQQMAPAPPGKGGSVAGIILGIIGGIFFVIVILAVLAISGVRKYIANAKVAEARNAVSEIARDAQSAYERESMDTVLTAGAASSVEHRLCGSASTSVPTTAARIRGIKYQSSPSDWSVDESRDAGFACLKYTMDAPQYFMYSYKAVGDGTHDGDSFTATANGDLDGDGVLSTFSLDGRVSHDTLNVSPTMREVNPTE